MEYINTANIRRLVAISREKRFVEPGETVELSKIDISMLGSNAAFMKISESIDVNKIQKKVAKVVEKKVAKEAPKTKKKVAKKKSAIKKVIEKVTKKKVAKKKTTKKKK